MFFYRYHFLVRHKRCRRKDRASYREIGGTTYRNGASKKGSEEASEEAATRFGGKSAESDQGKSTSSDYSSVIL